MRGPDGQEGQRRGQSEQRHTTIVIAAPTGKARRRAEAASCLRRLAPMADEPDRPLLEEDLDPDPLVQLRGWLAEAREAGVELPEAMTLATATREGHPSARMVLLKDAGADGLTFYSGYESRKGNDLAENPRAALVLYWHSFGRQVRVEGSVARIPPEQSDEYFRSRLLGSRLSAAVSHQSEVVASREELEHAAAELERRRGDDVERPETWGGYRLVPELWEFWQHRLDRLHDRFRYRPGAGGWIIERLAP
jgi:pyridoxamine 5'-phosphate oxidase